MNAPHKAPVIIDDIRNTTLDNREKVADRQFLLRYEKNVHFQRIRLAQGNAELRASWPAVREGVSLQRLDLG